MIDGLTHTICSAALIASFQAAQPKQAADTRQWIAANVCAAAHDSGVDPRLLTAYLLTENRGLDIYAIRPAVRGRDHGLFQVNSHYQRHRTHLVNAHHPYYGALIAGQLLEENLKAHGWSWKAFAAYWSAGQATRGTAAAQRYYSRFKRHYDEVDGHFARIRSRFLAAMSAKTAQTASQAPKE